MARWRMRILPLVSRRIIRVRGRAGNRAAAARTGRHRRFVPAFRKPPPLTSILSPAGRGGRALRLVFIANDSFSAGRESKAQHPTLTANRALSPAGLISVASQLPLTVIPA